LRSLISIPDFATEHGISRSLVYKLIKEGRGPKIVKINSRSLISIEAGIEWRARMEAETR
jgi:predicted DNA-binding transcriptional regulator AlpA